MTTMFNPEVEPMTDEEIAQAIQETENKEEVPVGKDEDAPWGRRKDGTPRKRPGPPPKAGAPRVSAPSKTAPRSTKSSSTPDYESAINGLLQIVSIPLAFTSPLDALAVAEHGPGLAAAAAQTARERPEVAAVLDKLTAIGPYGLLIGAMIPLAAQIAANHDVLPPAINKMLGVKSKDEMTAQLRAAQMAAQAQAESEY